MEKKLAWAEYIGAAVVLLIFVLVAITATGQWPWVASIHGDTWASWVQAIGSLVAIGVAIWVPWNQREHDNKQRADSEHARAYVIASSVRLMLNQCMGALQSLIDIIEKHHVGSLELRAGSVFKVLDALALPNETQVLGLLPIDKQLPVDLTRGIRLLLQVKHVAELLRGEPGMHGAAQRLAETRPVVVAALELLTDVANTLDRHFVEHEGPDTELTSIY